LLITLKVDIGSYNRVVTGSRVKRGELLGLSPHFDDQVVLSPIDGIIERIKQDREEQAVLISIRRQRFQPQAA
jgi:hypothetical protein